MAPECGPWSGWTHLNQFKSVALFDKITRDQAAQIQHIQLCAKLCEYQAARQRHFHLEQPLGSSMPQTEAFQKIHPLTQSVSFDMCRFGLKIPKTNKYLRKSRKVFSTSDDLLTSLSDAKCPGTHEHQPIEGQVWIHGIRQTLTRFCATYCTGFAKHVAKCLTSIPDDAFVNEPHDDESPNKRPRFQHNPAKRFKVDHLSPGRIDLGDLEEKPVNESAVPNPADVPNLTGNSPVAVPSLSLEPSTSSERWREAFRLANQIAPRVGNTKVDVESNLFGIIQSLVPEITIQQSFVCRGTERFQVPILMTEGSQCPMRHTVCLHRSHDTIHDLGSENWFNLRRLQRIRASVPSKLTITSFGTTTIDNQAMNPRPNNVSSASSREKNPVIPLDAVVPESGTSEPRGSALQRQTGSSSWCEGWAPPPVPLHGPAFRSLETHEKQDLVKPHKNLGHPDPKVLAEHLQAQKASPHIVEAAKEFVCDACVESTHRRHQRPAKLHEPREFNQCIGVDGFYWRGKGGFQVHVLHCIDEASLFHLGRRVPTRNPDNIISVFCDFWSSWAGNPSNMYADPAGEFRSQEFKDFLQSKNIHFELTTEAWQRGRIERHGGIIEEMLDRCDQESTISTIEQFDQVLISCFQAKNALSRHQGYSPEQIVLGKSTEVPASLTSDEQLGAHSLAVGDTLESEKVRKHLEIRSLARKTFLTVDNDNAIRRALLRKSCPARGPFEVGHQVMYWIRNPKMSRLGAGRWHGPAKIICIESPSAIWISHIDRIFKCAPESLRPASLREWQQVPSEPHRTVGRPDVPPEFGPTGSDAEYHPSPFPPEADGSGVLPEAADLEEYTPGTPLLGMTPQSTIQPETEAIPAVDVPVPETPVLTPSESINLEDPSNHGEGFADIPEAEEPILLCQEVYQAQDITSPLLQIETFQSGAPDSTMILASDQLPILDNPLQCTEEQCFVLEIPVTENDIHKWAQAERPEECAHVAAAGRRARSEVHVKNLNLDDRILFEKAKDAELECWLQTNALRPILRKSLNPEQILKSRWVLTWKNIEDAPPGTPIAKLKLDWLS